MENKIYWFIFLIFTILVSAFLHEVGHGLSASIKGHPVSTGFNRVGDYNKRPGDDDFREEHKKYNNPWDFGPLLTLILAIVFTYLFFQVSNKFLIFLLGGLAFTNSFLRLIPMIRSYYYLAVTGSFALEDEISMGNLWYQMSGILIFKYIPSIISLVISLLCLKYVLTILPTKMPELFSDKWSFAVISFGAFIVSMPIITVLDKYIRINWGSK